MTSAVARIRKLALFAKGVRRARTHTSFANSILNTQNLRSRLHFVRSRLRPNVDRSAEPSTQPRLLFHAVHATDRGGDRRSGNLPTGAVIFQQFGRSWCKHIRLHSDEHL